MLKLDAMGYNVGYRLIAQCTKDKPRMLSSLDVIKFLCKEFWMIIFRKQMDKLQTNHKGVFVLQDMNFLWIKTCSTSDKQDTINQCTLYLAFPCGLLRGALAHLGVPATVTATVGTPSQEEPTPPAVSFHIQLKE